MIQEKLREVRERIAEACRRSGRKSDEITIVLVSKEVEAHRIREAYELGVRDFGENRVQEFLAKRDELPTDIRWHMIGHLQTNKVKSILGKTVLIHSLDRVDLARAIQKEAEKRNICVEVLAEVNTSGESTKYGFHPDSVESAVEEIVSSCPRLIFRGLMTIGPNTQDQEKIRKSFRMLSNLRDLFKERFPKFDWQYLSMGMSSDFEIAVEEGANLLRIGTAVFGPRG